MSYFDDVGEFHRKFDLPSLSDPVAPHALAQDVFVYRYKFLLEELAEYAEAHAAHGVAQATRRLRDYVETLVNNQGQGINLDNVGLAKALDGLVDLVYVAAGTAQFHHFPFDEAWAEVQVANMAKERGPTVGRNHSLDVRKPSGWVPPDIERVIERRRGRLLAVKAAE